MKKNNKGFTLAELLIVVAIIAVLVAIAIPVFTTRLEQSRETTDIANLRSAYAAGQVAALSGLEDGTILSGDSTLIYDPNDGDGLVTSAGASTLKGQGTATNGKADTTKLPNIVTYSTDQDVRNMNIKLSFGTSGLQAVSFG